MSLITMLFFCIVCVTGEGVLFCVNEYVYLQWTSSLGDLVKRYEWINTLFFESWKVHMSFSLRICRFLNKHYSLISRRSWLPFSVKFLISVSTLSDYNPTIACHMLNKDISSCGILYSYRVYLYWGHIVHQILLIYNYLYVMPV